MRKILILALVLAALPGCKRRSGGQGAITIAGSTSVQPFAEQWGEAYHESHPDVEITVQGGGSTAGVKATMDGAADIGTCSRELKAEEKDKVVATVVALDGETVIVHPGNPVSDLTVEQVRGIYAGEISNWKDVGGKDQTINVVTREVGSGARGAFEELAMNKQGIVASALVQNSQGAVRQMVSTDSGAIGYVSHGVVDKSVKPLELEGVEPSLETVKSGTYPLVRPFLFLTKGPPAGQVKEFIDWVLSPEGQAIAAKEGLFPPK